ncbi:transcription antitermination factor NusB [Desulfobacter sp.]|jgi:N utilization substance protein B|uniref:transcription antitermination factor NusB n=1 Tax=Desulfobacter sp. TaxID=2294 RepID=UPI000E889276|nr:transcription antitermination factor NusB [Desulfobacter sp.]MBP8829871.1 transcription antitermination factor NusB [Desulfobacter sp.]MBP9598721.1 transcription antitermination factor NusB [Desulfobacter sp.]MDQ1271146.1 transcription antitermination protein NusB [Thermodesulfobacteriota bacterium]HBT88413.1 transcription antitermination factor NusB [Desulfobacter sp.]
MGDRRKSRELALQALFALDLNKLDLNKIDNPSQMDDFLEQHGEDLSESTRLFFLTLVEGVLENRVKIDLLLDQWSKNWKTSRMPVVDRNIMRIAVFEMLNLPDIPPSVSINEAVEIGKKFGTRDSGPFINGVLDRIRVQHEA